MEWDFLWRNFLNSEEKRRDKILFQALFIYIYIYIYAAFKYIYVHNVCTISRGQRSIRNWEASYFINCPFSFPRSFLWRCEERKRRQESSRTLRQMKRHIKVTSLLDEDHVQGVTNPSLVYNFRIHIWIDYLNRFVLVVYCPSKVVLYLCFFLVYARDDEWYRCEPFGS